MELFLALTIPFLLTTIILQSVSSFDWPLPDNPRYQTVMPHNEHRYWPPEVISEHRYWPPPQQQQHPNPPPHSSVPTESQLSPPSPHRVINVHPINRNHRPSQSTRDSLDSPISSNHDRFRSSSSQSSSDRNQYQRFRSSQDQPSSPVRHVPYDEPPYHHPMDHYQPQSGSERSTESSSSSGFHATEIPLSSVYEPKESSLPSSSYSQNANERMVVKPQNNNFRQSANHVRVKERITPATSFQFDPLPPLSLPPPSSSSQESPPPKQMHHYNHDVFNDPQDHPEEDLHLSRESHSSRESESSRDSREERPNVREHSSRDSREERPNVREHSSSPRNKLPLQADRESEEAIRREQEFRRREEERIKEEKRIKEEADRIREETRRRDENRRRDEERRRKEEERRKIEELRRREEERMRQEDERRKEEEEKQREEERRKEEELKEEEKKEKERLLSREQPSEESADYDRSHDQGDHSKHPDDDGQSWPLPKPPQPVTEAPKVEELVTKSYRPRPVSRPRGGRYGRRRMSTPRTTTTTTPAPLQPAESDQPEYYDDDDEYYDYPTTTTTRRPRRRRPKGGRRIMTPEPTSSTTPSTTTKRTTLSPGYRQRPDGRIIDFRADPNYPHELKGFDLTEYPFYIQIPDGIKFKCDGRHDGYYANVEHFCQIYHHCAIGNRYDFLCPNYTLFDQTTFTCRFVNTVDCKKSDKYYDRNFELYVESTTASPAPSVPVALLQQQQTSPFPSLTTPNTNNADQLSASFSNTNSRFKKKENNNHQNNNKNKSGGGENKDRKSSTSALVENGSKEMDEDGEEVAESSNRNHKNDQRSGGINSSKNLETNGKRGKEEERRDENNNNNNQNNRRREEEGKMRDEEGKRRRDKERTGKGEDEERKKTSSQEERGDKNNNNDDSDGSDDYVDVVNEE